MPSRYDSSSIEVLKGLDPVRKRPGMYTITEQPNHLAQEVVDNSVDEAIAGFANWIEVIHHNDGSLSVIDNGRGMPVDYHKGEKVSGVEVIMTRLHAGAKFSSKNYRFSGGLHGVGVSVVNALSQKLEVNVRRNGKNFYMSFSDGKPKTGLKSVGKVGSKNTGTQIRFWPDPKFFDNVDFSILKLKRLLRAKAVLCSGLKLIFKDEVTPKNSEEWEYKDGVRDYLLNTINSGSFVPENAFFGQQVYRNEKTAPRGFLSSLSSDIFLFVTVFLAKAFSFIGK